MGAPRTWTGTNAIAALRNTIGDPSGAAVGRWTDAELAEYIDRGQWQVTLDTNGVALETVWTADIVGSQREYKLPTNFYRDRGIYFVKTADTDIRELKYLTWGQYQDWGYGRDEGSEGEPAFYYFWRKLGDDPITIQPGSLFLHPTPNSASAGTANLKIYGYKYPDDISADTTKTMELEGPYVEAALTYAAALVKMDDDELSASRILEEKYERSVNKLLDSLSTKTSSQPAMLAPRQSAVMPGWFRRNYPVLPWERRVR